MNRLYEDIKKILSDCIVVFYKDSNTGKSKFGLIDMVLCILLPISFFFMVVYNGYVMNERTQGAIVPILSLFIALVFQVLYIAADKYTSRANTIKNSYNSNQDHTPIPLYEDERNYLIRFANYTRLFIRELILIIFLSLIIIVLYILLLLIGIEWVKILLTAFSVISFYYWIFLLLKAIVSIYTILNDDIEQSSKFFQK